MNTVGLNIYKMTYNHNQWKKYKKDVYLLMIDKKKRLTEWEDGFIHSINKKIGFLSEKQILYLDKIISKYFH